MAKAAPRKMTKGGNRKKVGRPAKTARPRPAKKSGKASAPAKSLSKKTPPKNAKKKAQAKSAKPAKRKVKTKGLPAVAETRTRPGFPAPPPPPEPAPPLLREYLVPGFGRGHFPFFPFAAYLAFGLAAGAILKRTATERLDRLMQWAVGT